MLAKNSAISVLGGSWAPVDEREQCIGPILEETATKTVSSSLGSCTPRSCSVTPNGPATSKVAFAFDRHTCIAFFQSIAARVTFGNISLSSSNRLGQRSEASRDMPVDVAPGWAELRTVPVAIGSLVLTMTIGMAFVACSQRREWLAYPR